MEILNKEVRDATLERFESGLVEKVTLLHFTQEASVLITLDRLSGQDCMFCRETRQLMEEVAALSDKIELSIRDFKADQTLAAEYGVDKIPATIVLRGDDTGIRFFGIPSGYEYMSLIEAIVDVSRGETGLSAETKEALKTLDTDVRIQVFVTPTCPYCTSAVRLAHQMAMESPRIKGEMVEATEFPHLVHKYGVFGVPRTVVNETEAVEGAVPEPLFLASVLKMGRTAPPPPLV